jgi:hypothetical protein
LILESRGKWRREVLVSEERKKRKTPKKGVEEILVRGWGRMLFSRELRKIGSPAGKRIRLDAFFFLLLFCI